MRPRIWKVWMGMFRPVPGRRPEWLRDADATPLKRELGPTYFLADVFGGTVARQLRLSRCIELAEKRFLEVPEQQWAEFEAELKQLARSVNAIDSELATKMYRDESGRTISQVTTCDAMIAAALDFIKFAERHRGKGYVVSISAE